MTSKNIGEKEILMIGGGNQEEYFANPEIQLMSRDSGPAGGGGRDTYTQARASLQEQLHAENRFCRAILKKYHVTATEARAALEEFGGTTIDSTANHAHTDEMLSDLHSQILAENRLCRAILEKYQTTATEAAAALKEFDTNNATTAAPRAPQPILWGTTWPIAALPGNFAVNIGCGRKKSAKKKRRRPAVV